MKKYNLSNIMKRAWELVKKIGITISSALKIAWSEAKEMLQKIKFEGSAKVLKAGYDANECTDSGFFYFNRWTKAGKDRIYCNDYKGRGLGYIDVITGEVCNAYNRESENAMHDFMERYAF